MKTSCRRLENVFGLRLQDVLPNVSKTFSRRLQDILEKCLQDVLKMSSRRLAKMSSRLLGKMPSRCSEDVFKTSCQDVFKTSSKHLQGILQKRLQDILKTSSTWSNIYNGASFAKILNSFKLLTIFAKKASSQKFDWVENRFLAKGLKY